MSRLFDEHIKREVKSLSGIWQMQPDPENIGEIRGFMNGLPESHTVSVPSVWNSELGMLTYEGVCWYEKIFHTEGGVLRFSFGAVMSDARVYLDGELIGSHYGGYCRFTLIKRDVKPGKHRLTVRVDNSFDDISIPQPLVDWYHYGGITRDIEVERLSGIAVLYSNIDYTLDQNNADVSFTVELYNAEDQRVTDELTISLDGKTISESKVTLDGGEMKTIKVTGGRVAKIERWSAEHTRLYTLCTETSSDDLYDRVGFRHIEIRDRAVYLNGKKIRFRGINRHEEHPEFGMAFPEVLMHRDIEIIKNMGVNSIRGSHYPNNPKFVDLLDEHGIFFWSEIPMWGGGFPREKLADPRVIERGLLMHKEMIHEYYNHPSIIIWGMHNEIDTRSEEALNISKIYYEYLKKNGGNRLVTYATNKMNTDICFKYCDFIAFNSYVGWYEGGGFPSWEVYANAMEDYLIEQGVADKPVVTSEFGAAAIYGHHTFDNLKWTEEYQAKLISDCIKLFFSREEYAGSFVWQFADIRTSEPMGLNRARSFNNKGVVNEYRRPKMAYGAIKTIYESEREKEK